MGIFSLVAIVWLSGGFVIHHSLPSWALAVYGLVTLVNFAAWAVVRCGLLYTNE